MNSPESVPPGSERPAREVRDAQGPDASGRECREHPEAHAAPSARPAREALSPLDLERLLSSAMDGWRARLRSGSDLRPRRGERGIVERSLVRGIMRCACAPEEDATRFRALTIVASAYGTSWRASPLDEERLDSELTTLRDELIALADHLSDNAADQPRFVTQLDLALTRVRDTIGDIIAQREARKAAAVTAQGAE